MSLLLAALEEPLASKVVAPALLEPAIGGDQGNGQ